MGHGFDQFFAQKHLDVLSNLNREQFKPPRTLRDLIAQGRYGLKNLKGFYDYDGDAAQSLKRERDRKLYARLNLFRKEQKHDESELGSTSVHAIGGIDVGWSSGEVLRAE